VTDKPDKRFTEGYRVAPMPTDYAVQMGILWVGKPDLETQSGYWSDAPVTLEGRSCDGYTECDYCSNVSAEDSMDYCDNCGYQSCYSCGCDCEECEGCGEMFNDRYGDHCDNCEKCDECGEVVRSYDMNEKCCDDCMEQCGGCSHEYPPDELTDGMCDDCEEEDD